MLGLWYRFVNRGQARPRVTGSQPVRSPGVSVGVGQAQVVGQAAVAYPGAGSGEPSACSSRNNPRLKLLRIEHQRLQRSPELFRFAGRERREEGLLHLVRRLVCLS